MSEHPNASCFLYQLEDGLVLAVPRADGSGYGLPGGKEEPGEDALRAAQRELIEETGYHCDTDQLRCFHKRVEEGEVTYDVSYVTYANRPPTWVTTAEGPYKWVTRDELLKGPFGKHLVEVFKAYDLFVNGGWIKKVLMWNWHKLQFTGFPGWETETEAYDRKFPAFAKLSHTRNKEGEVESHALAAAWDDVAEVHFYQRDWTDDNIPFVKDGETYWSGWWFQTIAERDRFLEWVKTR